MDNEYLEYFDELANTNIKDLRINAINDKCEVYQNIIEEIDYEKGIIKYWNVVYDPIKDEGIDVTATYNFYQEFINNLSAKTKEATRNIDEKIIDISSKGINPKEYLINQIKTLNYLSEKLIQQYPGHTIVSNSTNKIRDYFIDKYELKGSFRKPQFDSSQSSFFEIKPEIKISTLRKLYDVAVELQIVDDIKLSETAFINVLTGNPTETDDFFIFKSDNQISVHFINCIQPLFNNLTSSQISKSKSFYNKNKKVLCQTDIDTANKRLKSNVNKRDRVRLITKVISSAIN